MRPIRVAITVPSSRTGGIARYGWNLIEALHRVDDVSLVPVGDEGALIDVAAAVGPVAGIEVPGHSVAQALAIRHGLRRQLGAHRVDLFHGLKHVVPAGGGPPSVLTAHDDFLFSRPRDYGRAKRTLLPSVYRRSLGDSSQVLAVSDVAADAIRARALCDEVATVRHPFQSDLESIDPEPVVGVGAGAPFALFVGEWLPRKNLDHLLAIWPEVRVATGSRLVVAGPPRGAPSTVDAMAAAVAAGDAVELGRVSDGELRWLYEHAHITCVPSHEEGWGLPVTESLSLGTAVLASDHPALIEAGGGASTHLPLAPTSAWVEALTSILTAPKPAPPPSRDAGRDWDRVAHEVADHYRQVLAAPAT